MSEALLASALQVEKMLRIETELRKNTTTRHPSPGRGAPGLAGLDPRPQLPRESGCKLGSNPGGCPSTELAPESMTWPEPFFASSSSSVKKLSGLRQADNGTIVTQLGRGRAAMLGSPSEPCPSTAASEGLSCSAGGGLETPFCRSAADGRPATEPSGSSTRCANAPAESSGSIWEALAFSRQAGTGTAATDPDAG